MHHEDLVTVIMPVYQGQRSILGAVASVLAQTHDQLEVIIVDDGSTDDTWPLLETITDPRVSIFRQSNAGAAAARNFALSYASGDYIAFLDADDSWLPDKITSELMTLHSADSPVGIAYSRYYAVDDRGTIFHRSPPVTFSGNVFADLTQGLAFILPSAALFHRAIFDDLGGFPTARRHHEDFAFILRAVKKYPAFPTLQYQVLYRQSLQGKGRAVMRDYDAAVNAAVGIVDELRDILTPDEADRLSRNQLRALYFRFLMYGFNNSARRLTRRIDVDALRRGAGIKGRIGWIFAKSGVNLMLPARLITQIPARQYYRYQLRGLTRRSRLTRARHRDVRLGEPLAH
jgi:glycosyltransferase involved in cell wall biosynthesis